jgi:LuxR family maltose regulon positive regulatory protein
VAPMQERTVARTTALLAKLSRPRLYRILDRERLFEVLEAARESGAVWISGPPGAGKTSLAASFLQTRRLTGIWYDVDAGDADPATFFHYLSLAAPKPRSKRSEPLLALSPEYQDLEGFTRRFLRVFYSRLPEGGVIVFDNCHTVGAEAPFSGILQLALDELPPGLQLILISRSDPPAPLARAEANGRLARIGWEQLRLTAEELRTIALATGAASESNLATLQQRSGGWAVGLVLLLQRLGATGSIEPQAGDGSVGSLNYFADQVFEKLTPAARDLLLCTAFLPRVTATSASALTANPAAGSLLEDLFRQRLFTDRHTGTQVSYQYHALFREFLQKRATLSLTPEALRARRASSARLLEEDHELAAAFAIRVDNHDWDDAARLILRQARALVADGRWLTLQSMIAQLPPNQTEKMPWLTLWLGAAVVLVDPARARRVLTQAFDVFQGTGDLRGCLIAATGIVETHNIEQIGIGDLDRWLPVLEGGIHPATPYPTPAERVRVLSAFVVAAMLRQPTHPAIASCLREVENALELDLPPTAKADAATQLLGYFCFTLELQRAKNLVARIGPLFEQARLTPFRRAGWLVYFSFYAALIGEPDAGLSALDQLRTIVSDFGMKWFRYYDHFFRALLHLMGPTPLRATVFVHELVHRVDLSRFAEAADFHLANMLLHQARREPALALHHGELSLEAASKTDSPHFNLLCSTVAASAFVEAGQLSRAYELVRRARAWCESSIFIHHEPLLLLVAAYVHHAAGEFEMAADCLSKGLRLAQSERNASSLRWLVLGFRRMLAFALESNAEAEIARSFIAELSILPESPDVESWPWPVRVRLLGVFELQTAMPQRSTGKFQKKPLEMLKILALQVAGEMGAAPLAQLLWPDADGDAALQSLEVTLRRLRKLLGSDDAVRLHEGRVSLNELVCWLDTLSFERAHQKFERRLHEAPLNDAELEAVGRALFSLYPAHVLPGEENASWLVTGRQRLASRMFRDLISIGQLWEERERWEQAELTYRRGVELEAESEVLYRRLMSVQIRCGDRAGALATYARCRQMLSFTLGVEPSAETETMRRQAMATV